MSYSDDDGNKPTPTALWFKREEAKLAKTNALKDAGITKPRYTAEDIARIERAKNTQHLKEEAAKTAKARAEEDARATAATAQVALDPAAAAAAEGLAAKQRAQVNNKDQPPQLVYRGGPGRKDRQGWPPGKTLSWSPYVTGTGGRKKSNRGKKHKNKQTKSRNIRKNKRTNKTRRFRR